jgi:hypothetical protein
LGIYKPESRPLGINLDFVAKVAEALLVFYSEILFGVVSGIPQAAENAPKSRALG